MREVYKQNTWAVFFVSVSEHTSHLSLVTLKPCRESVWLVCCSGCQSFKLGKAGPSLLMVT